MKAKMAPLREANFIFSSVCDDDAKRLKTSEVSVSLQAKVKGEVTLLRVGRSCCQC